MTESQLKKITEMVISEQGAMDDILNNSPNAPTYGAGTPTANSPKPTYGEPPKTHTTSEYFNVLERNGNKLMPHKFNDPNARDLEWGDTTTMTIWINGRINLWTNTGGFDPQYMGTMKITGNKSFKIIYDMGDVYDSKTNKVYSVGEESEENKYINCASSLDEIKEGSVKILKYGCKTDAVKELQKLLGMEEKYQTGYFGPITKGKVKEFQTSKEGLKVDGIVGSKTYAALTTQSTTPENTNDTTQTTPEPTTQPEQTNEYFNGLNNLDEDEDITMLDNLLKKD